jgi:large subunit ribosomal protein L35
MQKLKTKKGVAKRFRLTKKGKIKYGPCGKGHLLTNKKKTRLRRMKKTRTIDGAKDRKYLKEMLPYGRS